MSESPIRPAVAADLPELTEIYNHFVRHTPYTFDLEVFSVEERRAWFAHFAPQGPHRLLVHESEGGLAGYASSSPLRPKGAYQTSVETSVYVAPSFHGQGIGSGLYAALFAALAGEDVHRAYAGITVPNPGSVALHQKFGFTEIGTFHQVGRKFDQYWDVKWFQKPVDE